MSEGLIDASFYQPKQSGASLLMVAPTVILAGSTRKLFLFSRHEQPTADSLGRRFVPQKHISDELAWAVLYSGSGVHKSLSNPGLVGRNYVCNGNSATTSSCKYSGQTQEHRLAQDVQIKKFALVLSRNRN